MTERIHTVVVGAGPAGLATSAQLSRRGVEHVVLERGRVGETWRSQRWDSFCLNSPAWGSRLPLAPPDDRDDRAFATRPEVVDDFERYAGHHAVPVREGVEVLGLHACGEDTLVETAVGRLRARHVVIARGWANQPRTPEAADRVPARVAQLHSAAYRRPDALAPGAALVVGSGQSGAQIAEELLAAGRDVYLATGRVARMPRRHRGRDTAEWWHEMGRFDEAPGDVAPAMRAAAQRLVSGARGGHTLSLQQLARDGAVLLGRLHDVRDGRARFGDELADHLAHGDRSAEQIRAGIDDHIRRTGAVAPPAEPDPSEAPLRVPPAPRQLDLRGGWVGTIVWATGFHRPPVLERPGVHCVGRPWMTRRSSGVLLGMGRDAAAVAERIAAAEMRRIAA